MRFIQGKFHVQNANHSLSGAALNIRIYHNQKASGSINLKVCLTPRKEVNKSMRVIHLANSWVQ